MHTTDRRTKIVKPLVLSCLLLLVLVTSLSAFLRHSAAGLGCSPRPRCYAQIGRGAADAARPDPAAVTAARAAHRVVATVVLLLVITLVVVSLTARPVLRREAALSFIALVLAALLALLGVFTPGSRLPAVVLGNLLGGFLMLAVIARLHRSAPRAGIGPAGFAVAMLLLVQIVGGALLSARHAGLACDDLRECLAQVQCAGADWRWLNPWWESGATGLPTRGEASGLHLLHRLGAGIVALATATLGFAALHRGQRAEGFALLALLVTQWVLGVTIVDLGLPLVPVLLHNLCTALLLAVVVRMI